MRRHIHITAALLIAAACVRPVTVPSPEPPPVTREMRGLWVATVRNIDWPSKDTLTADQQRAELVDIFDRAAKGGFNAIMFHVRPAGDAVYESALEPWGAMLTGRQGVGPGYDPLAFAVQEAHARGLELHAWINPFRAGNSKDSALLAPTHMFNARRDLIRVYGTQLWFDPGDSTVQEHSMRAVADIVTRYDVDGVHADDYFYPYPERDSSGKEIVFPDSETYARSGSTLSRDDWRRENIDRFVERMYREVHRIKPAAKVGLSPFGIWRPGNPPSVAGFDAYASIYADSKKWLQAPWVDYLTPQLYWAIAAPQQSFPALLDWWIGENTAGRYIWPGLATYRVNNGTPTSFSATEIPEQIRLTRQRSLAPGTVMFNTTATLKRNNGAILASITPLYGDPVLVPPYPWLGGAAPAAPTLTVSGRTLRLTAGAGSAPRWWYVRSRARRHWWSRGERPWVTRIVFGATTSVLLDGSPERVIVQAVDEAGNLSAPVEYKRGGGA